MASNVSLTVGTVGYYRLMINDNDGGGTSNYSEVIQAVTAPDVIKFNLTETGSQLESANYTLYYSANGTTGWIAQEELEDRVIMFENVLDALDEYVPDSRLITAGTGTTGGGDLSANIRIDLDFLTSGGVNGTGTKPARNDHTHSTYTDHLAATDDTHGIASGDTFVGVTATQTLTNKTLTSPVINTPTGIVKGDISLGNVDNTSDATKNSASVTLTNKTLTSPIINSPTGLVKGDVGLGNVDNTSDATKNSAIATLTNKTLNEPKFNEDVVMQSTSTQIDAIVNSMSADVTTFNTVVSASDTNSPMSTLVELRANYTIIGGAIIMGTYIFDYVFKAASGLTINWATDTDVERIVALTNIVHLKKPDGNSANYATDDTAHIYVRCHFMSISSSLNITVYGFDDTALAKPAVTIAEVAAALYSTSGFVTATAAELSKFPGLINLS